MVYNHTAEGNRARARRCRFRGIDNAAYYRLLARGSALLHGLHRLRQHPEPAASARAAAHHGLAALLGARDARRRLPLRSRLGARARALRRRPPGLASSTRSARIRCSRRSSSSPSPGTSVPAATRSATFPPGWNEWNDKYRDTMRAYWKGDGGLHRRLRAPLHRARATCMRRAAASRTPASTSSPRTTASRCTTSSATTASTTRPTARTTATATTTIVSWNCGVEGATDDPGGHRAARAAEAQSHCDAAAVAGRADAPRRGRARPHSERQQQRLLPGQRDLLAQLGSRPRSRTSVSAISWRRSSRCAASIRSFSRPPLSAGRPRRRRGVKEVIWLTPDGSEMTEAEWDQAFARCLGVYLAGVAHPAHRSARRDRQRR